MSWTDEEIDSLFKEASSQHKALAFQDAYFEEIEKLLPKKKSKKPYIWFFGSSLVLLSGLVLFFGLQNTPQKTSTLASQTITNRSNSTYNATSNTNRNTASSSQSVGNTHSAINKKNLNATENDINTKLNLGKETVRFTPYESEIIADNSVSRLPVTPESEASKSIEPNLTAKASEILVATTFTDEKPASSDEIHPEIPLVNPEKQERILEKEFSDEIQINPVLTPLTITDGFQSYDEQEILALKLPSQRVKQHLSAEIGAGFSENFIRMKDASQQPMLSGSLGLSYRLSFQKLFFSSGLSWANFKPNQLELNRQSKVYGFKTTYYAQSIDYKWINMIEVPVIIGKKFNNQTFYVGVSPSIMLGSRVDFTKTQNGEEIEKTSIYGNMLGLKKYALSVQMGYDINVSRNLDLGLKVSNLLINPLDETRFTGSLNKYPFQAQLTLKKHFRIR